jgi:hypothetical protein
MTVDELEVQASRKVARMAWSETNRWVVPDGSASSLVGVERHGKGRPAVRAHRQLPVPALSPCAVDLERDLLVFAHGAEFSVLRGLREGGSCAAETLVLPEKYEVRAVSVRGGVAYVGGRCGSEVLGRVELESGPLRWQPMDVPEEVRRWGKAVDAFVWRGERLVAVDDIVMPKWLLVYDTAWPLAPRLVSTVELQAHCSYETIHAGVGSDSCIGLISTSMNHGWSGVHLSILDASSFAELGLLTTTAPDSWRGEALRLAMHGLDSTGDRFIVACGDAGVGVLDASPLHEGWAMSSGEPTTREIDPRSLAIVPVRHGSASAVWSVGPELALVALGDRKRKRFRTSLVELPTAGAAPGRFLSQPQEE